MPETLWDCVHEARRRRLKEKGFSDPDDVDDPAVLLGDCLQNAQTLSDVLAERGISHQLVGGALKNCLRPDDDPESFTDVKARGEAVHYWIEANGYVCEIAAEDTGPRYGKPLVAKELPPTYRRFADSVQGGR